MFAIGDEKWAGLSKLLEEAGEVIQVGGKLMGSRGDHNHWSGNLREKLVEELGDLYAALDFFSEHNLTDRELNMVHEQFIRKQTLFKKWHLNDNKD
jgi:NTP pyrophosphatase (non-canonical NTP hydrolase)